MKARRTYWHLSDSKRKPSEYDIATGRLLYYPARGFEVNVPLSTWYERYQRASPLRCSDWDLVRDPRETTYAKYTELQTAKQMFVDGLLRSVDAEYDRSLSVQWIETLGRVLGPMRYPMHGLQMIAAYVGHMAPGGRIVCASMFQAADEIRRIQVVSYRMRQLQKTHTGFGEASRRLWEEDPAWQPLRELIERLLVTYDWGEAFAALNLVVKPAFDDFFMSRLGRLARGRGDDVLSKLLLSLNEDCEWHREWTRCMREVLVAESSDNRATIDFWVERWRPAAQRAVAALEPLLGEGGNDG